MKKLFLLPILTIAVVSCTADEAIKRSLTNINEELIVMQKSITDNQIAVEELNALHSATQSDIAANADAIAELRAEIAYVNNEILLIKNGSSRSVTPMPLKREPVAMPKQKTEELSVEVMEEVVDITNRPDAQQVIIIDDSISAKNSIYSYAMELLRMKRHDESRVKFQEYIDKYPGDKLAGNAQYWIGETYYTVGDMNRALKSFELVRDNFPQSVKVSDALLKIGYVYDKLGDRAGSVVVLKDLIKKYPKTQAATLANQKLRGWGR